MKTKHIRRLSALCLVAGALVGTGCSSAEVKALGLTQAVSFAAQLTGVWITTALPSPFGTTTIQ